MKYLVTLLSTLLLTSLSAQTLQKKQFKELKSNYQYEAAYKMMFDGFALGEQGVEFLKEFYSLAEKTNHPDMMLESSRLLIDKTNDKKFPERHQLMIKALKANNLYLEASNYLDKRIASAKNQDSLNLYYRHQEGILLGLSQNDPSTEVVSTEAISENIKTKTFISNVPNGDILFGTPSGSLYRRTKQDTVWSVSQPIQSLSLPKTNRINNINLNTSSSIWYAIETLEGEETVKSGLYSSIYNTDTTWSSPIIITRLKEWGVNVFNPFIGELNGLKTLFFSSDMKGGFGGKDIYYVTIISDTEFTIPKNAGSNINTSADEIYPHVINNRMYFSSNNDRSIGGFDIYHSLFGETFGPSKNAGVGINSSSDDWNYIWLPRHKKGAFLSNRSQQKDAIYEVTYQLKPSVELLPVLDASESVGGIKFEVFNVDGSRLKPHSLLEQNIFWLEQGQDYKGYISKEGYYADTIDISTTNMKAYERVQIQVPLYQILAKGNVTPTNFQNVEKWLEGQTTLNFEEGNASITTESFSELMVVSQFLQQKEAVELELVGMLSEDESLISERLNAIKKQLEAIDPSLVDRIVKVDFQKATTEQRNQVLVRMVREVTEEDVAMPVLDSSQVTRLYFEELTHDFGVIKKGEKVSHVFNFTNIGDHPFVIEYAAGSCGCTVPSFPKDAVHPGAQGSISVTFDSTDKSGVEETSVTIIGNIIEQVIDLKIKATIE